MPNVWIDNSLHRMLKERALALNCSIGEVIRRQAGLSPRNGYKNDLSSGRACKYPWATLQLSQAVIYDSWNGLHRDGLPQDAYKGSDAHRASTSFERWRVRHQEASQRILFRFGSYGHLYAVAPSEGLTLPDSSPYNTELPLDGAPKGKPFILKGLWIPKP